LERDQQINIRIIINSDSNSRRQMIKYLMAELIELEIKGEMLTEGVRTELLQHKETDFLPIAKALEMEMNQIRINKLKSILDRLSGEK
jgi:hypothetical protein